MLPGFEIDCTESFRVREAGATNHEDAWKRVSDDRPKVLAYVKQQP
jgi:hypothetical protein